MRARIDVSEIEAKTKIRAKYLRALENEEWSLLPGPTFVKSFLRTYASALGLDGKALVEEYRLEHERPSEGVLEPIVSSSRRGNGGRAATGRRQRPRGPSRAYMLAVGGIGLVIVVLVVLLISNGGGSNSPTASTSVKSSGKAHAGTGAAGAAGTRARSRADELVALALRPSAPVYVCLVGDDGRKLIAGLELQPDVTTRTYRARRFLLTLGNSSVTLIIDGRPRTVPPSSEAIGYSITKARGRQRLTAAEMPTCR